MPPPTSLHPGLPSARGRTPASGGDWADELRKAPQRITDLNAAVVKAGRIYIGPAVVNRLGADFKNAVDGILLGMMLALGTLLATTVAGTAIGAGVGALGFGAGAAPGAVVGGRLGMQVGVWLLEYFGLAFIAVFVLSNVGLVASTLAEAVRLAWQAEGSPSAVDEAARRLAEAVARLLSLVVQGIVMYLSKAAAEGRAGHALGLLRESRLFRKCAHFEGWLAKNFARLRAEYVPLRWAVLEESAARIPNTSIPEWMRLRVGQREFVISRNKDAVNKKTGEAIGPAMKHVGEQAVKASDEAKESLTDYPVSALAAVLDRVEAELLFKKPGQYDLKDVDGWDVNVNTTDIVWRVHHFQPHTRR